MLDVRLLLLFLFICTTANAQWDLFSSAISAFKPLVEERRSHIREGSTLVRPQLDSQRDSKVLGANPRTPLNDVPICTGDGKLCAFIACQAENFKNDQTFANLNLAAQVMGDKKLRHQVGDNPEAINAVCMDSGMDAQRCSTFTRGFQMIAKMLNQLEDPIDSMQQRMPSSPPMQSNNFNSALSPLESPVGLRPVSPSSSRFDRLPAGRRTPPGMPSMQRARWQEEDSWGQTERRPSPPRSFNSRRVTTFDEGISRRSPRSSGFKPIVPSNVQDEGLFGPPRPTEMKRMDDYDFSWASPRGMPSLPPSPSSSSWSSSSDSLALSDSRSDSAPSVRALGSQTWSSKGEPILAESNNDRNDLLASFTPIPPTSPPLAFPTVKSVLPSMDDLLLNPFRIDPNLEKMLMPLKIEPILRYRRHSDDFVRVFEHMARNSRKKRSPTTVSEPDFDDDFDGKRVKRDYYDQADAEDSRRQSSPRGGSGRGGQNRGRGGGGGGEDYYDQVESNRPSQNHRNSRPGRPKMQRNCFELLG